MLKIILFLLIVFSLSSYAAPEQLVLVLSSELNATTASMQRYEKGDHWVKVGDKVPVTLGRNGLGYTAFKQPLKMEGDGRSPAGSFPIISAFGYDQNNTFKLPYWYADENLYCVDDVNDSRYNKMLRIYDKSSLPASYEAMRRADGVYRYGAVIGYNLSGDRGRGSCIFIHLNHSDKHPTSGCTAMDEAPLLELLKWLDPKKTPLMLQVLKSECQKYIKDYEGIECD